MKFQIDQLSNYKDTLRSEWDANGCVKAYVVACTPRRSRDAREVSWWNGRLSRLRNTARKLFRRAKYSGEWGEYKAALTQYSDKLRRSKKRWRREFCESIKFKLITALLYTDLKKRERSDPIRLLKSIDENNMVEIQVTHCFILTSSLQENRISYGEKLIVKTLTT